MKPRILFLGAALLASACLRALPPLPDAVASGLVDYLSGQGKASEAEAKARARALLHFLSANPEAYLADPASALKAALAEAPRLKPMSKSVPFKPALPHACLDLDAAKEAEAYFCLLASSYVKVSIAASVRLPLLKAGLEAWTQGLDRALNPPCALQPGLIDDFERGGPRSMDIWTDHGVRSSSEAVIDASEHFDGGHSLRLSCEPKGWGADFVYKPSYVRPSKGQNFKSLVFQVKVASACDLHLSLHEPEGDWEWKKSLHLEAKPSWQEIKLPFSELTKGKKKKGWGGVDPGAVQTFDLLLGGAEGSKALIYLDHLYFQ